ncbi:MAG: sigma-70 family RNA polymerase sigma factor [Chloroflexi bacterium]|nr:MAG: sigma-70 family RNA polymerase sigma factor [Chloroflexota bacterium]
MNVTKALFFRPAAKLDERAFEAIFNEHYARVYAILFRLTGDRYEADDLAAETFWRLWERPPAQEENLAGWLYRVAMRLGYNNLRAGQRRKQYETAAAVHETGKEDARSGENGDPAQAAEQRIERAQVRATLRQMGLRDAQLLVLRHSGLSYKEIATAMEIAAGSVGTLLSRAETKFEALYRQEAVRREGDKDAPNR